MLPRRSRRRALTVATLFVFGVLLSACAMFREPGTGKPVSWSALPGWRDAALVDAWPALQQSCVKLGSRSEWRALCDEATRITPALNETSARAFFENWFVPHVHYNADGEADGLLTGYYEPLLYGSRTRSQRFHYPLYRAPDDLLTVDLGDLYPELRGQRVRGRLHGKRVVPYYNRAQIDGATTPLAGNELIWVDNAIDLFFLHIQGSGRVQLDSGETLHIGYADQNGHPYVAIGRLLRERMGLAPEEMTVPVIRHWLDTHPQEADALLHANPSYVFFALRDPAPGPLGSLGVPLYAQRAIAVDPKFIPLGVPVWLDTMLPDGRVPYRRLVFAQDTGGAIRGPARADLFLGHGNDAAAIAGRMRQPGQLYVLLPVARR